MAAVSAGGGEMLWAAFRYHLQPGENLIESS